MAQLFHTPPKLCCTTNEATHPSTASYLSPPPTTLPRKEHLHNEPQNHRPRQRTPATNRHPQPGSRRNAQKRSDTTDTANTTDTIDTTDTSDSRTTPTDDITHSPLTYCRYQRPFSTSFSKTLLNLETWHRLPR